MYLIDQSFGIKPNSHCCHCLLAHEEALLSLLVSRSLCQAIPTGTRPLHPTRALIPHHWPPHSMDPSSFMGSDPPWCATPHGSTPLSARAHTPGYPPCEGLPRLLRTWLNTHPSSLSVHPPHLALSTKIFRYKWYLSMKYITVITQNTSWDFQCKRGFDRSSWKNSH